MPELTHSPMPEEVLNPTGIGSSALPALAFFMRDQRRTGATFDEALPAVRKLTGLSETTVLKAWLTLIDLDLIGLVASSAPRRGRHRDRHAWCAPSPTGVLLDA